MASHRTDSVSPRRPARDIIDAVVDNMRKNLEPLKYSTLAASRYTVYLHPSEFRRLEGIVPILREQTARALREELEKLNRGALRGRVGRSIRRTGPEVQNAGSEWQVDFVADPDGDLAEGDMLVDSELMLPSMPELGMGERTRRITTVRTGSRTTTREHTDVKRIGVAHTGSRDNRLRGRSRPSSLRRRQGVVDGGARRHRVPGGRAHCVLAGRLAGARPDSPRCAVRPLLSHRFELAGHDAERPARARGVTTKSKAANAKTAPRRPCQTRRGSVSPTRCSWISAKPGDDDAAVVEPAGVSRRAVRAGRRRSSGLVQNASRLVRDSPRVTRDIRAAAARIPGRSARSTRIGSIAISRAASSRSSTVSAARPPAGERRTSPSRRSERGWSAKPARSSIA